MGLKQSEPSTESAGKERIALRIASSVTCNAGLSPGFRGGRASACSGECLACSLAMLVLLDSTGESPEQKIRTVADMLPSSSLMVIVTVLVASGLCPRAS